MIKRILVMGHSDSGKTYFSRRLIAEIRRRTNLSIHHFDADSVRDFFCDRDYSDKGRIRQAIRMRTLCDLALENRDYVIGDFICPTHEARIIFNPDIIVMMKTIENSIYQDTNSIMTFPRGEDFPNSYFIDVMKKEIEAIEYAVDRIIYYIGNSDSVGKKESE